MSNHQQVTFYSMSFTTATLLRQEMLVVAERYHFHQEWASTRAEVLAKNLLQMRTANALKRIFREASSRLQQLTTAEFNLLLNGTYQEQNNLLWLAFCKRYRFVYDLAVTVIREKYLRLDYHLTYDDYDIYFNNKAEWHPEVERIADSTRTKQRQVVFKTMREADLLTADNHIIPAYLTPKLIKVIVDDAPQHLAIFPASEAQIRGWVT